MPTSGYYRLGVGALWVCDCVCVCGVWMCVCRGHPPPLVAQSLLACLPRFPCQPPLLLLLFPLVVRSMSVPRIIGGPSLTGLTTKAVLARWRGRVRVRTGAAATRDAALSYRRALEHDLVPGGHWERALTTGHDESHLTSPGSAQARPHIPPS
ncbi:hypothetical protein GGS23DRAFT_233182 [Durotheca rogersii]|uniref:uncharacterized protein n=1 Tax=Durotheca rogersii TaxID=419775 RepID=UPI00221F9FDD|nr:uncharacterized protein GGS23DRAFT_233182 [Durotheca rogersii]KAI5860338.1 hypothetical protein GGS23DRAFT_233182 [Durotheca rogersii]